MMRDSSSAPVTVYIGEYVPCVRVAEAIFGSISSRSIGGIPIFPTPTN